MNMIDMKLDLQVGMLISYYGNLNGIILLKLILTLRSRADTFKKVSVLNVSNGIIFKVSNGIIKNY